MHQSSTQVGEWGRGGVASGQLVMLGHPETWGIMREMNYIRQSSTQLGYGEEEGSCKCPLAMLGHSETWV